MIMKKALILLVVLCLCLCGLAMAEEAQEAAPSLSFSAETYLLPLGTNAPLKVTPSGLRGKITYTYASDDESVFTVTSQGILKSVALGTAHVTVTATDRHGTSCEASCTVRVITPVSKLSLGAEEKSLSLAPGIRHTLSTLSVLPEDATIPQVHWYSDRESVAVVDESGTITAVAAGTCKIYAETQDGTKKKLGISVTVKDYDLIITSAEGLDAAIETQNSSVTTQVTVGGVSLTRTTAITVTFEKGCAASDRDGHLVGVKAGTDKINIRTEIVRNGQRTVTQRSFTIYVAPEGVVPQDETPQNDQ